MKKGLLALFVTLLSAQGFAASNTFQLVSTQKSNPGSPDLCSETMTVEVAGNTVILSLHPELGTDLNIDSKEGDVVLNKVNQGAVTDKRKTFAHGETIRSKVVTTLVNGVLEVESTTKFSYGIIPNGKSTATLKAVFTKTGAELEINRSFDSLGSSSDWSSTQVCSYKLVK